ncbi:MAG TPA: NAD(P)-binding protein, partial [Actinomycetota bacterium]|nr:NAD(P)-binding protein [Actinomycetota bacterium]
MTKQRIVIVGAGPAGLSTAFNLTDPTVNPGWQDRYEIDVYQLGWRVGGKGATGRNPDAGERIEEHGIHVFGNMYFNTLRMMAACYEEVDWDEHDRHRSMDEAFLPSLAAYATEYWDGAWHGKMLSFPSTDEPPWTGSVWPDDRGVVQQALNAVDRNLGDALLARRRHPRPGLLGRLRDWAERLLGDTLVMLFTRVLARVEAR